MVNKVRLDHVLQFLQFTSVFAVTTDNNTKQAAEAKGQSINQPAVGPG